MYYTNRWFAGEPYQINQDASINFNWGSGDLIPDIANNYVSIEWNGFLMPAFTEAYTFQVQSNDGIRLWIN